MLDCSERSIFIHSVAIEICKRLENITKTSAMDADATIVFKGETFMEILLVDYRWVFVCFFLLPLSFVYNLWFYVRNAIVFHMSSAPRAHDEKVRKIQKQVIINHLLIADFEPLMDEIFGGTANRSFFIISLFL